MYIILLGEGCNISQIARSLNIKNLNECSIFEWFLSAYFSDINIILEKVADGEELIVTGGEHVDNLYMNNTQIRTTHYAKNILGEKLKRRVGRFLDQVKSDDLILFIREDKDIITTREDIEKFKQIIFRINPNCNYKILLLMPFYHTGDKITDINNLYHKSNYDLKNKLVEYINECESSN